MAALETIIELQRQGDWAEIRRQAEAFLAAACETDLARVNGIISTAYARTAQNAADWCEARRHAYQCRDLAAPGSYLHVWALHQVAWLAADTGRFHEARVSANAFLRLVSQQPGAARFAPWVHLVKGQIAYQKGQFMAAAAIRRRVHADLVAAGNDVAAARVAISLAWAYARAGRPDLARPVLPEAVPAETDYLRLGAEAAILAAEGRWSEAMEAGKVALRGDRLAHDFADAAEVALIVARAAHQLGCKQVASTYIQHAALLAARQDRKAETLTGLTLRAGGGVIPDAAASRGSGGYRPGDPRYLSGVY